MADTKKTLPIDRHLLLELCHGSRAEARALREILMRWRSTRFEDWGYPVVRMSHESWAEAFDVSVRQSKKVMAKLHNKNLIHRRIVRSNVGTGFVVTPSYRVQLTMSAWLIEKERYPREVPQHLIVGRNPYKLHLTRHDTSTAMREQLALANVADEVMFLGGLEYAPDLKIKAEKAAGNHKMALSESAQKGTLFQTQKGTLLKPYRTILTDSSYGVGKQIGSNMSSPGSGADKGVSPTQGLTAEPGKESPSEKSLNHIPEKIFGSDLKIKPSNVLAFLKNDQEGVVSNIGDVLAKHGVPNKNNPNAPQDALSSLKPQYDETSWQKGVVKTWRDALVKGKHPQVSIFAKEIKNLKDALIAFPPKDKLAVLEHVLVNWEAFCKFCIKGKYRYSMPDHPTPGKVVMFRVEIEAFWNARKNAPDEKAKAKADMKGVTTADDAVAAFLAKKAAKKAAEEGK